MTFYVKLEKQVENEVSAVYPFWSMVGSVGSLEVSKNSGEITLLKPVLNDNHGRLFIRAAAKLKREWQEGLFPEIIEWAS
ncbi:hypothetical protein GT347_14905 [Xylophilus rhododendri]|uniref:Uncharacterized protein n=1 Tax=Xylophilus rhododendri TaxID=2697032 RepID=A0A857J7V3_9BURK|nr:hypothetical protein [Xylophilus rhododendri]QHI99151.1 hypothetical protein GT347_14905 [Xylophilus rhododendri]